jgi:hypothetical protein
VLRLDRIEQQPKWFDDGHESRSLVLHVLANVPTS